MFVIKEIYSLIESIEIIIKSILIILLCSTVISCTGIKSLPQDKYLISLSSDSFTSDQNMSNKFTFNGGNISPHISWDSIPENTSSLILIGYDKDIPFKGFPIFTWVHWIVYNISPDILEITEGAPPEFYLENNIKQGTTTFKTTGYGGPDPPFGQHRYFFRILAVDKYIEITEENCTLKVLKEEIKGHILGEGEIYGIYEST